MPERSEKTPVDSIDDTKRPPLWTAVELAEATGGSWIKPPPEGWVAHNVKYYFSPQSIQSGDLVLTKGSRDKIAHLPGNTPPGQIAELFAKGASAVITDRMPVESDQVGPLLLVDATRTTLDRLAAAARDRMTGKIICISGSAGKTTSKDALALVLGRQAPTFASSKSQNAPYHISLHLARTPSETSYGVYEVPVGDWVEKVSSMMRPHVVLITNIHAKHLNTMNSVFEVAIGKAKLMHSMEPGGTLVLNRDDKYFEVLVQEAEKYHVSRLVSFGADAQADLRLLSMQMDINGTQVEAEILGKTIRYWVGIPGRHAVSNSLGVLAVVHAIGADVEQAAADLGDFNTLDGRLKIHDLPIPGGTFRLIDDSFSATPVSLAAGLKVMSMHKPGNKGRRIAVLGDIGSLGEDSAKMHSNLAPHLIDAKIECLFTAGKEMRHLHETIKADLQAYHARDINDLYVKVLSDLQSGDLVYVKGSGSVEQKVSRVVHRLKRLEPRQDLGNNGSRGFSIKFLKTKYLSGSNKHSPRSVLRRTVSLSWIANLRTRDLGVVFSKRLLNRLPQLRYVAVEGEETGEFLNRLKSAEGVPVAEALLYIILGLEWESGGRTGIGTVTPAERSQQWHMIWDCTDIEMSRRISELGLKCLCHLLPENIKWQAGYYNLDFDKELDELRAFKALRPDAAKPIFLALRPKKPPLRPSAYLSALANAGLSPIVAYWEDVKLTKNGYAVVSGIQHGAGSTEPMRVTNEAINPSLIFHAFFSPGKRCTGLIDMLMDAFPKARASWSLYFKKVCQKSELERVLSEYETHSPLRIRRPLTVIASANDPSSIDRIRNTIGPNELILVKPAGGTHCSGIELTTTDHLDLVASVLENNSESEFVVQRVIGRPALLSGHRFDIRLYAMAWSFDPVKFTLYEQGVGRIAGIPSDPDGPPHCHEIFTGQTYRKKEGLPINNATLSEVLELLSLSGLETEEFWAQVNEMVRGILEAIVHDADKRKVDLSRNFFITGLDTIIEQKADGLFLNLIEINETPTMVGWERSLQPHLAHFYRRWGEDLANISHRERGGELATKAEPLRVAEASTIENINSITKNGAAITVNGPREGVDNSERPATNWTKKELIDATGGEFLNEEGAGVNFFSVVYPLHLVGPGSILLHAAAKSWPSRQVRLSGQSGMKLDDLIRFAEKRGAALIITSDSYTGPSAIPILRVANSYETLFALANYGRARFKGRVIAITGTAGKSSTRDFLGDLLDHAGQTTKSFGNWNSVEGSAMCLASLPPKGSFAVVEVSEESIQGQRKRSSLEFLRADDAIITSIGIGATQRFPNTTITAEVMAKLFRTLPILGRAYWPNDIAEVEIIRLAASGHQARVVGDPERSTIFVDQIECGLDWTRVKISTSDGSEEVVTQILGSGPLLDFNLAAQCAFDLGVPTDVISRCISEFSLARRKMEVVRLNIEGKDVSLLDDTFNAELLSFESMLSHIRQLGSRLKQCIFIIGKIISVEGNHKEIYERLARKICDCEPFAVVLYGDELGWLAKSLTGKISVLRAPTPTDAVALVNTLVDDGAVICLKGSSRNTRIRELSKLLRTSGKPETDKAIRQPRPLPSTVIEAVEQPHRIQRASTGGFSIGFAGDTYLGELYAGKKSGRRSNHPLCDGDYDGAFAHLDGFLHASDLNIANLETPLTVAAESPFDGMRPYLHWARPDETLSCLARHNIDVVTLANNHFYDYGQPGMLDTLDACNGSPLIAIGAGRNLSEAARPLSIDIKMQSPQAKSETHHEVLVFNGFAYRKSLAERFASYAGRDTPGCFPLRGTSLVHAIRHARKLNDTALIIVLPHWQRDYLWVSDRQRNFANAVLEAGADLVIGHGSHMMQQVERFGGKLAMHGIGNFVFNSAGRYAAKYAPRFSAAIRLIFPASPTDAPLLRLYPFLSCNRTTQYRPRFLTEEEFSEFRATYCKLAFVPSDAEPAKDEIGLNLELSLR